jgi:uncharacterized protein YjbI with pentapeptide repeats
MAQNDLRYWDLEGVDQTGAVILGANLRYTKSCNASLTDGAFQAASVSNAGFKGAQVRR